MNKYRYTPINFLHQVVPYSTGRLAKTLNESYVDVGGVFQKLADRLYSIPLVLSNKYRVSLVNVTCTHTGFSFGPCDTPPKKAQPLGMTWLFTLSIDGSVYYPSIVPGYSSLRAMDVRAWGLDKTTFVTIGFTHTEAQALGLAYDMMTPSYVYYLAGTLLKSFMLSHKFYTVGTDYKANYKNLLPSLLYSQFYMMPLGNLFTNVPYHLWVFNRHVWGAASFLLSEEQITAESLYYYLVYVGYCEQLSPTVEAKIISLLLSSMLDAAQRSKDSQPVTPSPENLLYIALVNKGKIDHTVPHLEKRLVEADSALQFDDLLNYKDHVYKLFYKE